MKALAMCFIISKKKEKKKKQTKINALNKLLNNVLLRTSEGQQDDLTSFSTDCKTVPFSGDVGVGVVYTHIIALHLLANVHSLIDTSVVYLKNQRLMTKGMSDNIGQLKISPPDYISQLMILANRYYRPILP